MYAMISFSDSRLMRSPYVIKSLSSGTPPIFRRSIVECQFPEDLWAFKRDDGSILPSGISTDYFLGSHRSLFFFYSLAVESPIREGGWLRDGREAQLSAESEIL